MALIIPYADRLAVTVWVPVGRASNVPLIVRLVGRGVDSRQSIVETRRLRLLVRSGPGIDQRPLPSDCGQQAPFRSDIVWHAANRRSGRPGMPWSMNIWGTFVHQSGSTPKSGAHVAQLRPRFTCDCFAMCGRAETARDLSRGRNGRRIRSPLARGRSPYQHPRSWARPRPRAWRSPRCPSGTGGSALA
jgi:hypothetical protein